MFQLWNDAECGVRVVRLTDEVEINALVNVFDDVAAEKGWQPGDALVMHRDRSIYFGLLVHGGHLAGGLQLVLPDTARTLPFQTVWPEVSMRASNRCAHVALLALDRAFRGQGGLFWNICAELWRHCVGKGIDTLYIECCPRVLALYRRLGWPLEIVGELRKHWGGDTYLCTLSIVEVADSILRRNEGSQQYQRIVNQMFRLNLTAELDVSLREKSTASQVVCA